jgi:hypothetical protein
MNVGPVELFIIIVVAIVVAVFVVRALMTR